MPPKHSNPIAYSPSGQTWATHVEAERQKNAAGEMSLLDKAAAIPGNVMNWASLKASNLDKSGYAADGKVFTPDTAAQSLYEKVEAGDQQAKTQWDKLLKYGTIDMRQGR